MSVINCSRRITFDEAVAEMDRRGKVIESLEAELDKYRSALEDIDAEGVDFGHFESASRSMQIKARKALGYVG